MKVLGEGESNGAISILHALGLGRGCSIGIQLTTKVQIVEDAVEIEDDRNGLLAAVEKCWRDRGLPTPDQFGWKVDSSIPIGQGLKSSSALSCAALRALNSCAWAGLSNSEIADIAANSQLISNCAKTGSMDDNWASLEPGWKLVDPTLSASESISSKVVLILTFRSLYYYGGKEQWKFQLRPFRSMSRYSRGHWLP